MNKYMYSNKFYIYMYNDWDPSVHSTVPVEHTDLYNHVDLHQENEPRDPAVPQVLERGSVSRLF